MQSTLGSTIDLWKRVGLLELQKELDTQSLLVIETQQQSLESRKKLALQTKGTGVVTRFQKK
jgi:hypothetical protein